MNRATLSRNRASRLDEWLLDLFLIVGVMAAVVYGLAGLDGVL